MCVPPCTRKEKKRKEKKKTIALANYNHSKTHHELFIRKEREKLLLQSVDHK